MIRYVFHYIRWMLQMANRIPRSSFVLPMMRPSGIDMPVSQRGSSSIDRVRRSRAFALRRSRNLRDQQQRNNEQAAHDERDQHVPSTHPLILLILDFSFRICHHIILQKTDAAADDGDHPEHQPPAPSSGGVVLGRKPPPPPNLLNRQF